MTNYWSQRLGQGQQQATPPPPPAPSNRPWWQPGSVQPIQQAPQQTTTMPAPQLGPNAVQQASVDPNGKVHIGDLLAQTEYTTQRAQSAKDNTPCPECGSVNYMGIPGQPNKMHRCTDCGFNPRFTQTSSGLSGTGSNVPVKVARVQNVPVEGAPPIGAVIGHV